MYIPSRKAALYLGVHPNTLRKWADEGKIKAIRNPAGQRLYDVKSIENPEEEKESYCYCRVSSYKQKDDLTRQVEYMRSRYPNHKIIEDIGSGLNFKRKGLIALLEQANIGNVKEVVVAHRDRLSRFGFDFIKWFLEKNGGSVVVLNEIELSPAEEVVKDVLSIITVFSSRIHGLRKYTSKIKTDSDISKFKTTENTE